MDPGHSKPAAEHRVRGGSGLLLLGGSLIGAATVVAIAWRVGGDAWLNARNGGVQGLLGGGIGALGFDQFRKDKDEHDGELTLGRWLRTGWGLLYTFGVCLGVVLVLAFFDDPTFVPAVGG